MPVIHKTSDDYRVPPNLSDYERTRAEFRWSDAPDLCEGMGGGCNRLVDVTGWLASDPDTASLPVGYFGASTGAGAPWSQRPIPV